MRLIINLSLSYSMYMKDFLINRWKDILLVVSLFVIITLVLSTTCTSHKNNELENNLIALQDTVHVLQLKNGDLLYERRGLILEKNELEKYLDISQKNVKELERKLQSNIVTISQMKEVVRMDTIHTTDSVYVNQDTVHINFNYEDKYVALNGSSTLVDSCSQTVINTLQVDVPLTVGTTENNTIFAYSDNPYVSFSSISGAQIKTNSTKPKHWNIGVQAGFGVQYDLIHKQLGAGPYIGLGISYGFGF